MPDDQVPAVGSPPLHVTEVDGVRTVWADLPGPLRAGLMVRMGSVDEALPVAGVSHLLEHLALFGIGRPGDHSNGFVDQTVSMFHTVGDEALVAGFLERVTRQLAEPPLARLDDERGVIRVENSQRTSGVVDALLTWRYGARGYGVGAQPALGIHHLDGAAISAWGRRFATRGNCALWMSGPPPAGLRLGLHDGPFQPPPDPVPSILPRFPAWYEGPPDGAGLLAVVPRGWAAPALQHALRARLVDELRTVRAVAYSPDATYKPLTGGHGQLIAVTDLLHDRQADGVGPFVTALQRLCGGGADGVTERDLDEWRALAAREAAEPTSGVGLLLSSAWQLLFGEEVHDRERILAEHAALTVDQVVAHARLALAGALVQVPRGHPPDDPMWSRAPASAADPVVGREYRPVQREFTERLVVTREGVSLLAADGSHLTVRADATAALLRWPDGRRLLIADDGNRIDVEPTLWLLGERVVAHLDAAWPGDIVVEMDPRDPGDIPKPPRGAVWRRHWARFGGSVTLALSIVALLLVIVAAGVQISDGKPPTISMIVVAAYLGHRVVGHRRRG